MRTLTRLPAVFALALGVTSAKAQVESLPQTPLAAAARIMQAELDWYSTTEIEVIDNDRVRFRTRPNTNSVSQESDIYMTRLDDCRYQLRNHSTGFVAQLNFRYLSSEYQRNGRKLIVKGIPDGAPFCSGEVPISKITDENIGNALSNQFCPRDLWLKGPPHYLPYVIRALVAISESCPFGRLPF